MPGRKKPEPTEEERTREYRRDQKVGRGDEVAGDLASDLDRGAVGEVAREREAWARTHPKVQAGREG